MAQRNNYPKTRKSRVESPESNEKRRQSLRNRAKPTAKKWITKICGFCNREYQGAGAKFCSRSCADKRPQKRLDSTSIVAYRHACRFTFNVWDFPKHFELDLIKQYGWYAAANRGNNLSGVSRDHLYSIRDGLDNSVDPAIMSHPANCRLVRHNENQRKRARSLISLEELKKRILEFDTK